MSDVQKEIALKVTTDTSQTQKAFANAQQELEETRKKLVDLALAGKQSSEEFRTLEARAGAIQDAIGDVNARVTALANDTPKLQLFGEAVRGVAAGFSIAQGAAALFGGENEDLQKAILQVQGSMALLNGVQEVANLLNKDSALRVQATALAQRILQAETIKSTLALRGWSAAAAATGIGALVVGLSLLVSWFIKSKEASEENARALELQQEAQDELTKSIQRTIEARQIELERMKLLGKTQADIALQRLADLNTEIRAQEKIIEEETKRIAAIVSITGKDFTTDVLENAKLRKEALINELLAQEQIIKEYNKSIADNAIQSVKLRLDAIKAVQVSATEENIKAAQKEMDDILAINKKGFEERLKLLDEQAQKEAQYRTNKKRDEEELWLGSANMAADTLETIAGISAAFAGQDEERQKKAFEIQKAAGIANTLIDTYAAAQSAFKSASAIPVIGPVAGPIAAASAVAAGLARVAQIRNTQFQSAASSAAPQAIRPAGLPQGGSPPPAAFNPNTSSPIVPPQGQGGAGQPQGQRVYVLERDIRNVGQRVSAAERFATFG